jgi:FkbM family methyltransferase
MITHGFLYFTADNSETYSQIKQDLFALFVNGKSPNYFVEFGACDGIETSNTYILEKTYGWTGILAEPAKYWHESLKNNRKCFIEEKCVANKSNLSMEFWETRGSKGVSGLAEYAQLDSHGNNRANDHESYLVETISLDDLLDKYNAPKNIGYLSIDTEGSELSILNSYSFSRKFNCITVEHNYNLNKDLIDNLIQSKGYIKVLDGLSQFDSWFINSDIYERIFDDTKNNLANL